MKEEECATQVNYAMQFLQFVQYLCAFLCRVQMTAKGGVLKSNLDLELELESTFI